ncbi:MAG TPA: ATP-dependent zinc protease [Deltaproteobacteria bacterium]|nr:ATP-dependent zinc protease [Deltaproteobacteria bacterium]
MKRVFLLVLCFGLFGHPVSAFSQEKQVVGWLETVRLCPEDLTFTAKIDTGAKTSSLRANHIEIFDRNGEQWVRFEVTDRRKRTVVFELKRIRISKIKNSNNSSNERPTVGLRFCIGKLFVDAEVNLTERPGFNYPLLLGRRLLSDRFLVDPSAKFTMKPVCNTSCKP